MSDIFREVEEEVRRDQLKVLWDRFGAYIVLIAVLIVVATAGWRGWQWYAARQSAEIGARYYEAVQLARQGKAAEAEKAFEAVAAEGGGFATLARLREAAAQAAAGDPKGAVATYDAIAADTGVAASLRDVARIRAAYLLLDLGDRDGVEREVGALAAEGNDWRHSARELLGLAAYQAGDFEGARQRFEELLGDPQTPRDMQARAQLMMSLLAADRPATTEPGSDQEKDEAAGQ